MVYRSKGLLVQGSKGLKVRKVYASEGLRFWWFKGLTVYYSDSYSYSYNFKYSYSCS